MKFNVQTLEALESTVADLSLTHLHFDRDLSVLNEPLTIADKTVPNRLAVQPMEGCDGTSEGAIGDLTARRYQRFASGGAGLIWFEAVAVASEGRANPRQLFAHPKNLVSFQRLTEKIKQETYAKFGYVPLLIMQATHSGRYAKPQGTPAPLIAYNSPIFEGTQPIDKGRIVSDDYLKSIEEKYQYAAQFAAAAGFDGIDVKCCHRYLASELLSAYTRAGAYGGSFENRTRFLRGCIEHAKAASSADFIVTSRLNVYDGFPYPYGFGTRENEGKTMYLDEALQLVKLLTEKYDYQLLNITAGNPYFNPHINRPYDMGGYEPDEMPLVGVDRLYACAETIQRAFPQMAIIGSGVSYLRQYGAYAAAGAVKHGQMAMQGFGREAFAYPDFAADILSGRGMQKEKCCIACSKCTEIMRAGGTPGCVIRDKDVFAPLYQSLCMKGTNVK